jgi:hypothetical protein
VRQTTYKHREWSFLVIIIVLGIVVGSSMGFAAKALAPVMVWAKSSPIETAKARRKSLLPPGSPLFFTRTA